ncbi:ABC transporter permease [Thermococcus sp. M36]|uniref:ABC transporter permease n=1 Tax=Thermococcus sp. M36 TaxID=1638261 RepID=UPI001438C331|nr:ABC transporter permease subunit [Thermococcus sp. M36]NJE05612.1 ABC transporter permease [Thermococcus sp. M36]
MLKNKALLFSVIVITTMIAVSLIGPSRVNPEDIENWDNILYWHLNPKNVPPEWYGKLTNLPKTEWLTATEENGSYVFKYDFHYKVAPKDIIIVLDKFESYRVTIKDPEGNEYIMWNTLIPKELNLRNSIALREIAREKCGVETTSGQLLFWNGLNVIFSKPKKDCILNPEPVKGTYLIVLTPLGQYNSTPKVYIQGESYGVMGTDNFGRDLWAGYLWGMRETIAIAVIGALFAMGLAMIFGMLSVLSSGLGKALNFVSNLLTVMPLLPVAIGLIIIISDINDYTYTISTDPLLLAVVLGILSVGDLSRNIRSIVDEELRKEYIESSKALGGSSRWILTRHVSKVLIPYTLYQFALAVPGIIALITLLGFFNVVPGFNWGTLMSQSIRENTVYRLSWWHILPVGISIGLMALSFVAIARDIERRFLER